MTISTALPLIIFNGVALFCMSMALYRVLKLRKLYKAEVAENEKTVHDLSELMFKYRDRYGKTCTNGLCDSNVTLRIEACPFEALYYYALYAYISDKPNGFHKVQVKKFFYNPYDEDSITYAYRCAEELKEKMEEEI